MELNDGQGAKQTVGHGGRAFVHGAAEVALESVGEEEGRTGRWHMGKVSELRWAGSWAGWIGMDRGSRWA